MNEKEEYPLCPLCRRSMAVVFRDPKADYEEHDYECEEHGEFRKVTVLVPEKILEFLKDHEKDMGCTATTYMSYNIIASVEADIDLEAADDSPFFDSEQAIKNYNLNPLFQALRETG